MAKRAALCGLALTVLAACSSAPPPPPVAAPAALGGTLRPYPQPKGFLQCVPFARTVSGIQIYGDAWTWWDKAAGHYTRGNRPEIGAVLAFRRTDRLNAGHVAVVVQLGDDPRRILVSHANWGSDGDTRGVIHERQPVVDVSPGNDWTQVRVMNRYGAWGRIYPTHGFIYQTPPRPGV